MLLLGANHPSASFQRKVLRPITLSNGQHLPAGVTIEIPAVAVNSDPALFPDPMKFDGLRFYRLREEGPKEAAAHQQFVSVGANNLAFGYGRHACPGRFFAANEIKMILTHVLLNYDMMLADGATERYPNIEFAHMVCRMRPILSTYTLFFRVLTVAVDSRCLEETTLQSETLNGCWGSYMRPLVIAEVERDYSIALGKPGKKG